MFSSKAIHGTYFKTRSGNDDGSCHRQSSRYVLVTTSVDTASQLASHAVGFPVRDW